MHSKRSDPYIKVLDTFFPTDTYHRRKLIDVLNVLKLPRKQIQGCCQIRPVNIHIQTLTHTHTHRQTWNSRTTHWQLYSAVTDSFVLHSAAGRAHTRKFFLAGRNASLRKLLRLENVSVEEEEKCSPYLYACGRKRTVDHGLGFNTFPVAYELTNSDQKQ